MLSMLEKRFLVVPDVIDLHLVDRLNRALPYAWVECKNIQDANGVTDASDTVHHLLALKDPTPYLDLLAALEHLDPIFTAYFRSRYVLHSLGGAINTKGGDNYSHRIHRDIRSHQKENLVLNTLVMLDDFTEENGATWLGGKRYDTPDRESFFRNSKQALGTAGSVLIFDSNTWHCAGDNHSEKPRRSITPLFCRPTIKPGLDYCRALAGTEYELSDYQRQIIGYNARIPASLNDWYKPKSERFYREDQDDLRLFS